MSKKPKPAAINEFTFYGDLVGISSLYAATPKGAYNALNDYYNIVFHGLDAYYHGHPDRKVEMFSDSIVVTGDDPCLFVQTMAPVYSNLLAKGLLLRGGMAEGKLDFDMRVTVQNFRKMLPRTDVLAKAASLERKVKGCRFLIDTKLANHLMRPCPEWLSLAGYARDPKAGQSEWVLQRALAPLPDGSSWEVLFPLLAELEDELIAKRQDEMDYLALAAGKDISAHFADTKSMLEHSKVRLKHHRGTF
jgi:hypothetical protein